MPSLSPPVIVAAVPFQGDYYMIPYHVIVSFVLSFYEHLRIVVQLLLIQQKMSSPVIFLALFNCIVIKPVTAIVLSLKYFQNKNCASLEKHKVTYAQARPFLCYLRPLHTIS